MSIVKVLSLFFNICSVLFNDIHNIWDSIVVPSYNYVLCTFIAHIDYLFNFDILCCARTCWEDTYKRFTDARFVGLFFSIV